MNRKQYAMWMMVTGAAFTASIAGVSGAVVAEKVLSGQEMVGGSCYSTDSVDSTRDGSVPFGHVLDAVETNNRALEAQRNLKDAQTLEARTGKFLENPSVNYERMWGKADQGKKHEWTVAQPFDFPSVYFNKNKLAKLKGEQYGHEYASFRRGVLLQAQEQCIEIVYLRRRQALLDEQLANAERIAAAYGRMFEAGQTGVIERNRVELALVDARTAAQLNASDLAAAEENLRNLNGGVPVVVLEEEYPELQPLASFETFVEEYLAASPELQMGESAVQVAERNVALSRAQSLPKFEAGYRYEGSVGGGERFNGFEVGMSVPLFENKNTVKRARAEARYAEVQLESDRIDARSVVRRLYDREAVLSASMARYAEILAAQKTVEHLNRALDAGQMPVTDYFVELTALYDSRLSYLQLERDYQVVRAQLASMDL